jgi:hypothetical protein
MWELYGFELEPEVRDWLDGLEGIAIRRPKARSVLVRARAQARRFRALRVPWSENKTVAGQAAAAGGGLCRRLPGPERRQGWARLDGGAGDERLLGLIR